MRVNPETGWGFVPSREICVDIKSAPLGAGLNPDEIRIKLNQIMEWKDNSMVAKDK